MKDEVDNVKLLNEFHRIKKSHKTAIGKRAARTVLGSSVIRVFKSRTKKEDLLPALVKINIDELKSLNNEKSFRLWFEKHLEKIRKALSIKNKRNKKILPGIKWGHAAKVLNLYIREVLLHSRYFPDSVVKRISPWLFIPVDGIILRRLKKLGYPQRVKSIKDIRGRREFYEIQNLLRLPAKKAGVSRIWFDDHSGRSGMTNKSPESLPLGWRWMRLGGVIAEALPGFAIGERDPKGVIQLRMNNVNTRGRLEWNEFIRVPATQDKINRYRLLPGDVVFNNTNSTELVGKNAVFEGHSEPIVYSNHFTRLRTIAKQLDSGYLSAWLLHQWQKRVFENLCNRWIGQSAVKSDKLLALDIPLPPLSEQKRIAAILNEQMAAVDKAKAAAEDQLEVAKALPAAYLRQVFPKPGQSLPLGWRWVRLEEVCNITAQIVDPKSMEYANLPHVSAEDIESGTGRLLELKTAAEDKMISGKYLFEAGNVLYSKLRPYLKKVVTVDFRGLCSADMYPIQIETDLVNANFLMWLLLSEPFTKYADEESRRARMPKLNREQLFSYKACLPLLSEQKRIAAILIEKMASVEATRLAIEKEIAEMNVLPAAILHRAFTGGF